MPDYAWVCHSCRASNTAGTTRCEKCGCPAIATGKEIDSFATAYSEKDSAAQVQTSKAPSSTFSLVAFGLIGLWLLWGALYQIILRKWFPLFPPQLDGRLRIFESVFGIKAGIYVTSLSATVLGVFLLCLVVADFRRRHG